MKIEEIISQPVMLRRIRFFRHGALLQNSDRAGFTSRIHAVRRGA